MQYKHKAVTMQTEEIKAQIIELMGQLGISESGDYSVLMNADRLRQELNDKLFMSTTGSDVEERIQDLEKLIELNKIIRTTWAGLTLVEREDFNAAGAGIKKIIQYRKNAATAERENNSGLHKGAGRNVSNGESYRNAEDTDGYLLEPE